MVAVPWKDASDATLYSLRRATGRSLGHPARRATRLRDGDRRQRHRSDRSAAQRGAGASPPAGHAAAVDAGPRTARPPGLVPCPRRFAMSPTRWCSTPAATSVNLMILGAATHGLKMQRLIATVPIRVAMEAPCSVMLVKQKLPFSEVERAAAPRRRPTNRPSRRRCPRCRRCRWARSASSRHARHPQSASHWPPPHRPASLFGC